VKKLFPLALVLVFGCQIMWGQQPLPATQNKQLEVRKDLLLSPPKIEQIEPLFDDCQLIFYVKGKTFLPMQGNRVIHVNSGSATYVPQITSWTSNKIDCKLTGYFEYGVKHKVYIYNTATHTIVSNAYVWWIITPLTIANKDYHVGDAASAAGHLLGPNAAGRQLKIGNVNATITQWTCEDILFTVPNLPPGVYKAVLMKGATVLSTEATIKIVQ